MFTARYELNLEIQFRLILVLKILVRHVRWLRRRLLKIDGTLRSCPSVHHEGYGGVVAFLHSFLILALNGNEWTYSCLCYCFIPTGKSSQSIQWIRGLFWEHLGEQGNPPSLSVSLLPWGNSRVCICSGIWCCGRCLGLRGTKQQETEEKSLKRSFKIYTHHQTEFGRSRRTRWAGHVARTDRK